MGRYTCFEDGKWRIKVGNTEFAGPWVDKLSYYEELVPSIENIRDEAYNLGYQTCLHAKELTWSEARELQAYRSTGLTVERAAELGKADQEGRVVVLPCKIGDTVYYIPRFNGKSYCGVSIGHVQMVGYTRAGIRVKVREYHPHNMDFMLGKTVFLTREEAEKALEAENHA